MKKNSEESEKIGFLDRVLCALKDTTGTVKRARQTVGEKLENWSDAMTAQVRSEFLQDWADITTERYGRIVKSTDDIEWDDPQIQIEWRLCDARTLLSLKDPETRAKTLATFSPDMLAVYYAKGDDGAHYCDLE